MGIPHEVYSSMFQRSFHLICKNILLLYLIKTFNIPLIFRHIPSYPRCMMVYVLFFIMEFFVVQHRKYFSFDCIIVHVWEIYSIALFSNIFFLVGMINNPKILYVNISLISLSLINFTIVMHSQFKFKICN